MEVDSPIQDAKRRRVFRDVEPVQAFHNGAVGENNAVGHNSFNQVVNGDAAMEEDTQVARDNDRPQDFEDRDMRRKKVLPIMDRLLVGLVTERDLYDRGVRLTQEQLQLYRQVRGAYSGYSLF